jgi:nitroreductase
MTFQELVHKRRSVRKYSDRPVAKEDLLKCLEAARLAPSGCNSQPWHFIVIDEPELRKRVAARIFSGIYSMNKFAVEAPVLVAVVSEKEKFLASFGGQIRDTSYCLVDIGIACEHLILQAQELGIGSCWIGWFDEKVLKEELRISKDKKIDIVLALGFSAEDKILPKTRKSLEEISSFNKYRNPVK